ncbi:MULTISPECIES: ABC transporter permease [Shouchella]|uniref:Oligopeptide ABC transporter permease n=3 Tax=Bacillaceae TaxID=186817 RepID=A0A060LWB5_9BACI|nr:MULTISPECIES: ABC transporter permease [Bacillaceae]RQW20373.1 ABC transporter permease [Bacillus sp. C1-1]AIC94497.1 oligopeptide ABC transporter permease [Shouchella lehensis G1]KQL56078.1 peptide ABC transporter permease [Alkalicoccobacillus plakortidis]MBG9784601.1 peptide ABC transporter permease [Shouchella lehensis]TES50386.1 ABC transporter permease [Shouchella lehensis]
MAALTKTNDTIRRRFLLSISPLGLLGLLIIGSIVLLAVFAPWIAPYDPAQITATSRLIPPSWMENGSSAHLLGTDHLGRDMFSRLIFGARVSLLVGVISVMIAALIGLSLGLVSGYFGGWIDALTMRIVDAMLAIPTLLLVLVAMVMLDANLITLILVIGLTSWVNYTRVVRGDVLAVKAREYVQAAQTLGASSMYIIRKHILPNVLSSFTVIATIGVGTAILTESSLSFLGFGVQPPGITWGSMLNDGRNYIATSWWIATFPGIAITITVLAFTFVGDWLRDYLDPRLKKGGDDNEAA